MTTRAPAVLIKSLRPTKSTGHPGCPDSTFLQAWAETFKSLGLHQLGGTVGQKAAELICQSERKTQQNTKISLSPLFSTEMDLILM